MSDTVRNTLTDNLSQLSPLSAVSAIDGRYHGKTAALGQYSSEYALIRYRLQVEVQWLLYLASSADITELPALEKEAQHYLQQLYQQFSIMDAAAIKAIEADCNHDVKAVEYWLRQKCGEQAPENLQASLRPCLPFLHFACTSEDINNAAYALMQKDLLQQIILPQIQQIMQLLQTFATEHAQTPMLARTHGQAASPTTLGKEIQVFISRLQSQQKSLQEQTIYAKFNGAVGNYHAHLAAYPQLNWPELSQRFIEKSLHLSPTLCSTQIEAHDHLCALLQNLCRMHHILLDLCRDLWGYIALGYLQQTHLDNEVGSSTMPHKINPIDFENAEGNLGMCNAMAEHLIRKLPISRWQRDLSDSTTLRNLGSIVGHAHIAYLSLAKGLGKISADRECMNADLQAHWEVLSEAVQSVMRRYGMVDAYEQLKSFTRGKHITQALLANFIGQLQIPEDAKKRLLALKPENYLGNAAQQVEK